MNVISLQSGSNGNCLYVEAGGLRLLFDAGIPAKHVKNRLAEHGRDINDLNAIILSHDHSDHVRCAGIYQRMFHLPIYATETTWKASHRHNLGKTGEVRYFQAAETLQLGDLQIETVPTPHDATDGVAFILDDGRKRLGIFTDLGHVFPGLGKAISTLDALLLESNYDPHMLLNGPYPYYLQQRISGAGGHISNFEAAELLRSAANPKLQWACLGHLSQENNEPELALRTNREILGPRFPLRMASRYAATPVMEV